jgi:hypothetical protein
MGMSDGPADARSALRRYTQLSRGSHTLLDTGDFRGMSDELLIRDALAGRKRGRVLISVKSGALRDPTQGWGG